MGNNNITEDKYAEQSIDPNATCPDAPSESPVITPKPVRKSSISLKHRQEGNQHYSRANQYGLAPVLQRSRLEQAEICYKNAIDTAKGDTDALASASKNYAKTTYRLFQMTQLNDIELESEHYLKIISHFSKALYYGQKCKSPEWRDDIMSSYAAIFEEAMEKYRTLCPKTKISIFEAMAYSILDDFYRPDLLTEIASLLFHESLTAIKERDFKLSLHCLKQMNRPIEEMKTFRDSKLLKKAKELEIDMYYNLASTESLQAIHSGDDLLERSLKDNEEMNVALVYVVIDLYRHAMVLSRDIEIELEAIALSRLGKVYDKVLKMKYRAKECYKKCLELAMSLAPRVVTSEPWHVDATSALYRYQQESIIGQDTKKETERKKFQEELSNEFKDLQKAQIKFSDSSEDLLIHIYTNYPVKRKTTRKIPTEEELKALEPSQLKKVYQIALLHYHPDKQDVNEHGLKWKVLCDEITKVLTNRYDILDC